MGDSHVPCHFPKLLNAVIEGSGDDGSINFTFEHYIFKPVHQSLLVTAAPPGLKPPLSMGSWTLSPSCPRDNHWGRTARSVSIQRTPESEAFLNHSPMLFFMSCHFVSTKLVHLSQEREIISYQTKTQPTVGGATHPRIVFDFSVKNNRLLPPIPYPTY